MRSLVSFPQFKNKAFRKQPCGRDSVELTAIFALGNSCTPRSYASESTRCGSASGGNHDSTK